MLYYCCAIVTEAEHGLNLYDMWILHLMISQKPILAIIDVDHKSIYHLKFCPMFIGLGGGDDFFSRCMIRYIFCKLIAKAWL